jgi:hypothetical protein
VVAILRAAAAKNSDILKSFNSYHYNIDVDCRAQDVNAYVIQTVSINSSFVFDSFVQPSVSPGLLLMQ